jgi:hypothetical protein
VGHPFVVTLDSDPVQRTFWTADPYPFDAGAGVPFYTLNMAYGFQNGAVNTNEFGTLCVRGAP